MGFACIGNRWVRPNSLVTRKALLPRPRVGGCAPLGGNGLNREAEQEVCGSSLPGEAPQSGRHVAVVLAHPTHHEWFVVVRVRGIFGSLHGLDRLLHSGKRATFAEWLAAVGHQELKK